MSTQKRKYELRARADGQAATRERIAAVTSELHLEVGPARTTVAEIARRAGVQRLTVYNNFPTDEELFRACGAHWLGVHPLPDLARLMAVADPVVRLRELLVALYGWYRETEPMTLNLERDRLVLPALNDVISENRARLTGLVPVLAAGFSRSPAARQRVRALIALALEFWTWRRLSQEGLDDRVAAALMVDAVRASVRRGSRLRSG